MVRKGWNVFTSGFLQNNNVANEQVNPFLKEKETVITKSERDPETLRKQILAEGYTSKKRKPVIEVKAELFSHKAKSLCTFAHENSFQEEAMKELKRLPLKKCTNSVFLEVQNIQNSFLQNGSASLTKPAIKFSSKFNGDFNSETDQKRNEGQENVPKNKPSQIPIILPSDKFLSSMAIQKVKKINNFCGIQSLDIKDNSHLKPNMLAIKRNDVKLLTMNAETRVKKELECFKDFKFCLNAVNIPYTKNHDGKSLKSFILAEEEFSTNKGSNWIQSLEHVDNEVTTYDDPIGKRKIRNIIPGGFTEQMLKLQRREKSEKVMWEHKIDRNRKKAAGNSLSLILISVLWIPDFVIAKCVHSQPQASDSHLNLISVSEERTGLAYNINEPNSIVSHELQSKTVIVLFKKMIFNKLHLKIRSIFQLCPPWQTLFLPSLSCPIILCTSYIDFNPHTSDLNEYNQAVNENLFLVSDVIQMTTPKDVGLRQHSFCSDKFFFKSEEPISLSARIQRIWKLENRKLPSSKSISNCFRYSLLLQEKDGTFNEILLLFYYSLPNVWKGFLSCCEGKCYTFSNLHIIQRFCSNQHQQFFKFLKLLSRHENRNTEHKLKQEFCYQLMFHSIFDVPETVSVEGFPDYCTVSVEPLITLFRDTPIQRFTCIGKVLFQYNGVLYISDESLLYSSHPKYIQIKFFLPLKEKSYVGSSVYVQEALFLEGCLLLDNYSKFSLLFESSDVDEELKSLNKTRMRQLAKVNLQSIISPISANSRVSEFVTVKGEITDVDESSALTWLQCNLCLHENLVQDSNLVIYCEDCSRVVPKPILNVKMEVTLSCNCRPDIIIHIQLLSITVKKILQITENNYQPKCNVNDVLGKKIGPLFGYIKRCSTERNIQIFHVSEISTS